MKRAALVAILGLSGCGGSSTPTAATGSIALTAAPAINSTIQIAASGLATSPTPQFVFDVQYGAAVSGGVFSIEFLASDGRVCAIWGTGGISLSGSNVATITTTTPAMTIFPRVCEAPFATTTIHAVFGANMVTLAQQTFPNGYLWSK